MRTEQATPTRQETLKAVLHYFYQDNTHAGSHCRYNLKYHLVWCPKYRRSFLTGEIAVRLRQILSEIAHDYRFRIIAMEVMPDHIHILVEVPPKYAPAKVVQLFKGISSRKLRLEFLNEIKRYIWKEGTLWAIGYYVGSVGDGVTTELIQEYINNQKAQAEKSAEVSVSTQGKLFN